MMLDAYLLKFSSVLISRFSQRFWLKMENAACCEILSNLVKFFSVAI